MVAATIGRAVFFAPEISTLPSIFTGPLMINFLIVDVFINDRLWINIRFEVFLVCLMLQ